MTLSRLIQAVFRGQKVTMTFDDGTVENIYTMTVLDGDNNVTTLQHEVFGYLRKIKKNEVDTILKTAIARGAQFKLDEESITIE